MYLCYCCNMFRGMFSTNIKFFMKLNFDENFCRFVPDENISTRKRANYDNRRCVRCLNVYVCSIIDAFIK